MPNTKDNVAKPSRRRQPTKKKVAKPSRRQPTKKKVEVDTPAEPANIPTAAKAADTDKTQTLTAKSAKEDPMSETLTFAEALKNAETNNDPIYAVNVMREKSKFRNIQSTLLLILPGDSRSKGTFLPEPYPYDLRAQASISSLSDNRDLRSQISKGNVRLLTPSAAEKILSNPLIAEMAEAAMDRAQGKVDDSFTQSTASAESNVTSTQISPRLSLAITTAMDLNPEGGTDYPRGDAGLRSDMLPYAATLKVQDLEWAISQISRKSDIFPSSLLLLKQALELKS